MFKKYLQVFLRVFLMLIVVGGYAYSAPGSKLNKVDWPLGCDFLNNDSLDLYKAISVALCGHPKTAKSWAVIERVTNQVNEARSAWLPSLNGYYSTAKGKTRTKIDRVSDADYSTDLRPREYGLELEWLLFDSGQRSANLAMAGSLLKAASVQHDEAVQDVIVNAASAYYKVQAAKASLMAARDASRIAEKSLKAAEIRHSLGASGRADVLQAATAKAEIYVEQLEAEREWMTARGDLAFALNLRADSSIPEINDEAFSLTDDRQQEISSLIDKALEQHPALIAARAELEAKDAAVSAAMADGRPKLSLTGQWNERESLNSGGNYTYSTSGYTVGLRLTIPIFDGFSRQYRVRQRRAERAEQRAVIKESEQNVSLKVWRSFHSLKFSLEQMSASMEMEHNAQESHRIVEGQYTEGITDILQLLTSQRSLIEARYQVIQSKMNWMLSRLDLMLNAGMVNDYY